MQTIVSTFYRGIKIVAIGLVNILFLFNCYSLRVGKSDLTALKFSDKIQYYDMSDKTLKTMQDSMRVYCSDSSVVVYEKYEELTETNLKYHKGQNNVDTAYFESTPTGKVKQYYFAFFKSSRQGYFFESLNQLDNYKAGSVDSVNRTSVGVNHFSVDSIVSYPGIRLIKSLMHPERKTMELKYAFTDGGDDGDSAFLNFSKTTTSLFSISPKLDNAYGMNLSSFVIVTNEQFNKQLNCLIPRREFVIRREEINVIAEKELINNFIDSFKRKFAKPDKR